MTTDFRALCVELLDWADKTSAHYYAPPEVLVRARAALTEPEPEYPSDKELLELMPETMRDEFSYAAKVSSDVTGVKPGIFRVALNTAALKYAQAILARWGK